MHVLKYCCMHREIIELNTTRHLSLLILACFVIYSSINQPTEPVPGQVIPWAKLYFPKGCGRTPGGTPAKPRPPAPSRPPKPPPDSSGQTSNPSPGVVPPGGNDTQKLQYETKTSHH